MKSWAATKKVVTWVNTFRLILDINLNNMFTATAKYILSQPHFIFTLYFIKHNLYETKSFYINDNMLCL
jgi:hypothetical protein